jgi:Tfp pilus assembly protein FimV
VGLKELKPGDLLFKGNPATHVGIYLGNGQFIHSPRTGDVVKIQAMSSYSGWDNARRIFDGGAAPAPAPAAIPADSVSVSAPAPVPAAAPAAPPAAGSYTTAAGDTLWKIAERTLGDANRWREIYDLNQASLSNLNLLFPGTVLTLPAGANIPAPAAAAPMAVAAAMPAGELRQLLVAMRDQVRGALSQIDQLTPRLRDVIAGMRPNA